MKYSFNLRNTKLYKSIFGYDIFISYSRIDSLDYAYSIAQHFLKKGYECYIDQLSSSTPGKELPDTIENAVKSSTAFVLIGSNGSKASIPIKKEINLFLINNKNLPLIPITIKDAISTDCIWFSEIDGLALIDDTIENLYNGSPSSDVLNRVESALQFTKKSKRLRILAISILASIILIICGTFFYTTKTIMDADDKVDSAQLQEEIAKAETNKAILEKISADSLTNILSLRADSLNDEILKNKLELNNSKTLFTKQYNSATAMAKEFDLAIEAVPYVFKYCADLNLIINKGELVLFAKLDRSVINSQTKIALSSLVKDWLNSKNMPKIIIEGYWAGYRIDEENLDIISLTGKGTSNYNLMASKRLPNDVAQYLIDNGIPRENLVGLSYGDTKPFSNGVLFNNRVEIYTAN